MRSIIRTRKSRWILLLLVVAVILTTIWTVYNTIQFFNFPIRTWAVKIPLMVSLTLLFASSYGVFLILYSEWAVKTRNLLVNLLSIDHRVIYRKYNRYFIDVEIVKRLGYNPSPIKKLSQKDIGYALEHMKYAKRLNKY